MPPSGSAEPSLYRLDTVQLLFDEQLSEVLVRKLTDIFPRALHVRLLDRGGASDPDVWALAREHGCILVTKDSDFHRLSLLHGAPPKVVWWRIGNCATADIAKLLTKHAEDIREFNIALHQTAAGAMNGLHLCVDPANIGLQPTAAGEMRSCSVSG